MKPDHKNKTDTAPQSTREVELAYLKSYGPPCSVLFEETRAGKVRSSRVCLGFMALRTWGNEITSQLENTMIYYDLSSVENSADPPACPYSGEA